MLGTANTVSLLPAFVFNAVPLAFVDAIISRFVHRNCFTYTVWRMSSLYKVMKVDVKVYCNFCVIFYPIHHEDRGVYLSLCSVGVMWTRASLRALGN